MDCYSCGRGERTFYAEENGFTLVKCDGCGLIYLVDRPADHEISEAHRQGRHGGSRELDVTGRFNTAATWLDVGCGHGEFLAAIQEYSGGRIAPRGTEPNVRKQESARAKGLDARFFDIESHEERYDGLSLLNVFSHLPDPPAFLASLRKLLEPGGELLLETGDTAHFAAADHYRPFHLPDHLSFASESIVVGILERLDFEIINIKKYPFVGLDLKSFAREAVKALLPRYDSRLRYYRKWKTYSRTDMFIRARLKG